MPSEIIYDQDPRFTSQFLKGLIQLLNIKVALSAAYYPKTDGYSECFHIVWNQYYVVTWEHDKMTRTPALCNTNLRYTAWGIWLCHMHNTILYTVETPYSLWI